MHYRRLLKGVGASIGIIILILDGKTALEGARAGIELCMYTVIPSLFPFFILSILFTNSMTGASLSILRPLGKICRIPENSETLLISGLLGGYPVGAQALSAAYKANQIGRADAKRMLHFCSNAGPAFLFGMISSIFPNRIFVWTLWGIHIASALLVAIFTPTTKPDISNISCDSEISIVDALHQSLHVMGRVCGWIILFRVVIAFFKCWFLWGLPLEWQVLIIGILELSNGCCELLLIEDLQLRFLLCSMILAFGGVCVAMQTASVIGTLPLREYLHGKCLQTIFSLLLTIGMLYPIYGISIAVLFFVLLSFRKFQKNSSNQPVVSV